MMLEAILRFLHLIALLIMATSHLIQVFGFRPELGAEDRQALGRLSLLFWGSAALTASFGLLLWLWAGKPAAFFNNNPLFHLKIGLFIAYLLLAVWPTYFLRQQPQTGAEAVAVPRMLRLSLRLQLVLLLPLPALAYLMARGVGY